ncbi:MAG: hypothetical protein A2265_07195 [Bacteroidetes bacterium RIFOXYA12_FULL_33_9]|nr:MAG: hypothetical protein A2265_07195 [Bacteroidetes bacterium RIFOXYA12_FULL_33_9]
MISLSILTLLTFEFVYGQATQPKVKIDKISSIPTPEGYNRVVAAPNTFASYLQNLGIKQENNQVYLFDGTLKSNQNAQFCVIKMDVGKRDLQQCADAVMRLRAEYLYHAKKYNEIHFNFLSDGKPRYYKNYVGDDLSYEKFKKYMDYIFSYANTASLKKELKPVININEIQIGDVFIQQGNPYGHAVTVVDVAENTKTGEKIFMIAQSYMPAQEIHILKNPMNPKISPWYSIHFGNELHTPEWTFTKNDLRRF